MRTINIRKALVAAGVLAATGIGGAVTAGPAQAAASDCPSGFACIWQDSGFKTNGNGIALVKFEKYIPHYTLWDFAGTSIGANDQASSVSNQGNYETAYWYENANHGGWSIFYAKKTGDSDLSNNGSVNDEISSGYFGSYLS